MHLLRRKACIGTPDGLLPPPIDGRVCVPTMELRLGQFPTDGGRGDGRKKKLHRNQINIRCSENCLLDPQGPHRSFSGEKRNSKKRRETYGFVVLSNRKVFGTKVEVNVDRAKSSFEKGLGDWYSSSVEVSLIAFGYISTSLLLYASFKAIPVVVACTFRGFRSRAYVSPASSCICSSRFCNLPCNYSCTADCNFVGQNSRVLRVRVRGYANAT